MSSLGDPFTSSNLMIGRRSSGLHRTDGPAVIGADGSLEWWVDGRPLNDFESAVARRAYERRRAEETWMNNA